MTAKNDLLEYIADQKRRFQTVILSHEQADLLLAMRTKGISAMTKADLERLKNRFDTIFNNVLCDMKPGWDDSIEGFNKAWDIARDIFKEEIGRAKA